MKTKDITMPITRKQSDYEQRIFRIQNFINNNYMKQLTTESIAERAAFSPYHFHRIFREITGETLYDYIQRIRLEKACLILAAEPETKIINIALTCGFSTASSFSKAFRSFYNISPSEFRTLKRENSRNGTLSGSNGKEPDTLSEYISDDELMKLFLRRKQMNVKIEILPEYRVAYFRRIGAYGEENIQIMQQLKKWAITRDLLNEKSIILGIAHDSPEITLPDKCRFDACIVIPDKFELLNDINETRLPGGKYAVMQITHSPEAIGKGWYDIFNNWLPGSGYYPDDRPAFERYTGSSENIMSEPSKCEICIPVKQI